jgi:hypothetical protein
MLKENKLCVYTIIHIYIYYANVYIKITLYTHFSFKITNLVCLILMYFLMDNLHYNTTEKSTQNYIT